MSPRPRKASDDEVFAAVYRVMMRLGPEQVTLAEIAAEAGLTAGALVQRFGSKRALLLALMARFADSVPASFAQLRAAHGSPVQALYAYAEGMAHMAETPHALAHHLSYLQLDITDADFHRYARAQAVATRQALQQLIEDAVAAGELDRRVAAAALAHALEVTVAGSLLTWAFYQDEPAVLAMRKDVTALLSPWLTPPA